MKVTVADGIQVVHDGKQYTDGARRPTCPMMWQRCGFGRGG